MGKALFLDGTMKIVQSSLNPVSGSTLPPQQPISAARQPAALQLGSDVTMFVWAGSVSLCTITVRTSQQEDRSLTRIAVIPTTGQLLREVVTLMS